MTNNELSIPVYLFHEGTNHQLYKLMSPKKVNNSWRFRVWSPHAKSISVVGNFNGWDRSKNPMTYLGSEIWETVVESAKEYDIYKFSIECASGDIILKSDPFANHAETAPSNASKLFESTYKWKDKKWIAARENYDTLRSPMNIYEVHLGSWKRYQDGNVFNYRQMADELSAYAKYMGYTHVEIMPVTEYPFDGSWGYQVTGMFAPTSRYGSPDDFKYFVDKLHKNGIGVILDWVVAHFPKDAHGLYMFDGEPCFEYSDPLKAEHKEWGTMVFDYARNEVKSFLISSAEYWINEFHIDGIRVDAVASMLYLDYGRKSGEWRANKDGGNHNLEAITFLQELNTSILTKHKNCLMIAEESTAFPLVTKPAKDKGLGFNYKWNMGWMNDTLRYLSANPFFRKDMHNCITFALTYAFSENYILPLSHDEVVHGKCSLLSKAPGDYHDKFDGLKVYYGFMMSHPGKKLLFMGGEFGQFIEWDFEKQLDWFLLEYDSHRNLQAFTKALNDYYLSHSEMYELDCDMKGFKWLVVDDNTQNIAAYMRFSDNGDYTIAVINFSPVERDNYKIGVPEKCVFNVALNSNSEKFGGTDNDRIRYSARNGEMHNQPYHISIRVPGNSVQYIKASSAKKRKLIKK